MAALRWPGGVRSRVSALVFASPSPALLSRSPSLNSSICSLQKKREEHQEKPRPRKQFQQPSQHARGALKRKLAARKAARADPYIKRSGRSTTRATRRSTLTTPLLTTPLLPTRLLRVVRGRRGKGRRSSSPCSTPTRSASARYPRLRAPQSSPE